MAEDVKDEVYRNYRFKLDFGGSRNGAFFTSIRSQGVKISTIDYRTGGGTVYKLPGHYTVSPIICEWGVTANLEMWNWMKSAWQRLNRSNGPWCINIESPSSYTTIPS